MLSSPSLSTAALPGGRRRPPPRGSAKGCDWRRLCVGLFLTTWSVMTITLALMVDWQHVEQNQVLARVQQMVSELEQEWDGRHALGRLTCDAHGGPYEEEAVQEMVYWREIHLDKQYKSPLFDASSPTKYLTFELDEGRFNNLRMSMETVIAMAHAMGRTLVMVSLLMLFVCVYSCCCDFLLRIA